MVGKKKTRDIIENQGSWRHACPSTGGSMCTNYTSKSMSFLCRCKRMPKTLRSGRTKGSKMKTPMSQHSRQRLENGRITRFISSFRSLQSSARTLSYNPAGHHGNPVPFRRFAGLSRLRTRGWWCCRAPCPRRFRLVGRPSETD